MLEVKGRYKDAKTMVPYPENIEQYALKAMSFDCIRRQVSINSNMSLNEIGAYTKGIVDLESEIFGDYMSAVRSAEE